MSRRFRRAVAEALRAATGEASPAGTILYRRAVHRGAGEADVVAVVRAPETRGVAVLPLPPGTRPDAAAIAEHLRRARDAGFAWSVAVARGADDVALLRGLDYLPLPPAQGDPAV